MLVFVPPESEAGPAPLGQPNGIQQIEDTLVVDLQEGDVNWEGSVLVLGYLLEDPGEYPGDKSWITLGALPVHGIALAGAGLAIGKNGGMVALQTFLDEMVDATFAVEVVLRGTLVEDVIEVKIFIIVSVVYFHFLALGIPADAGISITVFELLFEKRTDSDCCLYFAAHE